MAPQSVPQSVPQSGDGKDLAVPSRFWTELGARQKSDLDAHGFDDIKRRQALKYFTWRWTFDTIRNSQQFRFLLAEVPAATLAWCAAAPADLSAARWAPLPWGLQDRWLYTFAVRALWEYALRHDPCGVLALPEPGVGNPPPVHWRGRLISQDLGNGALEAAAITRALAGRRPRRIVEIGAGYGRTAYTLLHLFPEATYTIVDIEPTIHVSRHYLSQLFPAERLRFLSPDEARALPAGEFDLGLSISSLQEMTPAQVDGYLQFLDRACQGGSVFLKQWTSWHNPDDDVTLRFDDYPTPARWRKRFQESAPVQTNFQQAGWEIPA